MESPPGPAAEAELGRVMQAPLDSATDLQVSPILAARLNLQRRQEALAILRRDPALASELRIGRPVCQGRSMTGTLSTPITCRRHWRK
jgi:hypothetical protein